MEKNIFYTEKYKDIKTAWEKFIKYNEIDKNVIRPIIANSWLRCRKAGLDPFANSNKSVLSQQEFSNLLERNQFLIQAASPIIKVVGNLIAGSGYKIDLVSSDGYTLETVTGDKKVIKKSQEIGSVIGGNRSELLAGTNGIGLALSLGKTVQVEGPEHYNINSHNWTCAASPIRNSKNKIIGAINISGYTNLTHKHTKGMVGSVVSAVEKAILLEEKNNDLIYINKFLNILIESTNDGLIVINTKGIITHLNFIGAKVLGEKSKEILIGQKLNEIAKIDLPLLDILRTKKQYIDKETTVYLIHLKKKEQYLITTKFIKDSCEKITNIVVIFKEMKRIHRMVSNIIGAKAKYSFDQIIHKSEKMKRIIQEAKIVSKNDDCKVLICGESGTGKELFAQSIHNNSVRSNGPFIAINCSALPRDLVESELFGYEEGAFTGAKKGGRPGKFELADGGTLFLDEIESMPLDVQPKFLRVLESGEFMRIGGKKIISVNVRVISSTNEEIDELIYKGNFRKDLFYRISTAIINIPPLRERKEDIPILLKHIFHKRGCLFNENLAENKKILQALIKYCWPGNVRELENTIENCFLFSSNQKITFNLLPEKIRNYHPDRELEFMNNKTNKILNTNLKNIERDTIIYVLRKNNGNITKSAAELGIDRSTLIRKKKKYQISTQIF